MDEIRAEVEQTIRTLTEEQLTLVLAYARCLKDGEELSLSLHGLLEEPA